MGTFSKVLKYKKPNLPIDEKIKKLDKELKKTLGEAITNSTSGVYTVTGFEPGDPAIPEVPAVPAVPPTYENVTGGLSNANDFSWPSQGDGSNPDTPVNVPANLYTTYNGEQVAATRQIEGTYPAGVTPVGYVIRDGWLSTNYVGYLGSGGFTSVASVGVFANSDSDLGNAYQQAYYNWPYPGKIVKTIYLWGSLDCLFGSCKGGIQYSPSNLSNTSTPKADRALYPYTLWIAADANGNPLPNRIMTDPGVPEIPAIPAVPAGAPKPVVISRNALGDPKYYPGPAQPQGDIAQMGPLEVNTLLEIIRYSPPGQTRNNAIQQLNQWAKPGSRNRDTLIKMGVPLEGASKPTTKSFDISKIETDQGNTAQLRTMGLRPDGTHGYSKPGDKVYDPASKSTFEVKMGPGGRYQWMKI